MANSVAPKELEKCGGTKVRAWPSWPLKKARDRFPGAGLGSCDTVNVPVICPTRQIFPAGLAAASMPAPDIGAGSIRSPSLLHAPAVEETLVGGILPDVGGVALLIGILRMTFLHRRIADRIGVSGFRSLAALVPLGNWWHMTGHFELPCGVASGQNNHSTERWRDLDINQQHRNQ
jgi:hypothetical protein